MRNAILFTLANWDRCAQHSRIHTTKSNGAFRNESRTKQHINTEKKLENCCMQLNDNRWKFIRQGHETNSFQAPNALIQCSYIHFCLAISTLRYSQSQFEHVAITEFAWRSARANGHRPDTRSFVLDFPFEDFINLRFGNRSILSLFKLKASIKGLSAINSVNPGDLRQLSFRLLKHVF